MHGKIANPGSYDKGKLSYQWAFARMAVIDKIVKRNRKHLPLIGLRLGICLHITKETVVVMALSFANQLLSILYLSKNHGNLENRIYDVPLDIDSQMAEAAL